MKGNFEGYIFDLDDTLYCEHDYVKSGFLAVANEITKSYKEIDENIIHKMLIEEWKKNGRGKIFNEVCGRLKIDLDIFKLVSTYRSHRPQISLYEDARQLLEALRGKNVKLGMITDGDSKMQWNKIKSLGLERLFDCIVVTGDLGTSHWKPSDTPYRKVTQCLNLSHGQCVYIGDNPNKDFITARKLGMGTIRIVRSVGDHMKTKLSNEYEADREINSLKQLL
ncbi:HAD family hydrolase [Bacillus sp. FJAT-29790]|uniref:HAD family hydrolase n=1 Tax=Bacillus sp. FJAT-29790 TaxID=1895002 RepID=UPI001C217447|nr:HAD family hydrolase [Bacillus sp. FJAT-29790]MBU8881194.1 HAD family hydrolase [Bacillus sp. FJAT-29790]